MFISCFWFNLLLSLGFPLELGGPIVRPDECLGVTDA